MSSDHADRELEPGTPRAHRFITCHHCGGVNALRSDQGSDPGRCHKCGEALSTAAEAQRKAAQLRRARDEFLRSDVLKGTQLGQFHLLEVLGHGGMGVVYKGRDTVLDREVAIKVFPPPPVGNATRFYHAVLREARAAARLVHPYAVQVFQVGDHKPYCFIVMECVHGPTLAERLAREGPLDLALATRVFTQTAQALEAAHRQGLLHRDLKPSNLLFTTNDQVKVADFGLSAMVGDEGETPGGEIVGTPIYAAPEVLSGEPSSARADLYSLGAVMFEAITGRAPFQARSRAEYVALHRTATVPDIRTLAPAIPARLAALITRCLAKDPDQRPTAEQAHTDLRRINLRKLETFTRLVHGSGIMTRSGVPAEDEPDPALDPYMVDLGLRRNPFGPLRSGKEAFLPESWIASLQDTYKLLAVRPVALLHGPVGAGRSTYCQVLADRFKTPAIRLAIRDAERGRLLDRLLDLLHTPVDLSSSQSSWLMPLVAELKEHLAGDAFDPRIGMSMTTLIAHYQAAYRSYDALLVVIDDYAPFQRSSMKEISKLVRLARATTMRIVLVTDDQTYPGLSTFVNTLVSATRGALFVDIPRLTAADLEPFLWHKLHTAGGQDDLPELTPEQTAHLFRESQGLPGPLEDLLHDWLQTRSLAGRIGPA